MFGVQTFRPPVIVPGGLNKLKINFETDDAAPVSGTYTGEIGSLTAVDTNSIMSVANKLLTMNGTPAVGDGLISAAYSRVVGRILVFVTPTGTTASSRIRFGWSNVGTLTADGAGYTVDGVGSIRDSAGSFDTSAALSNYMIHALVLRSTGAALYQRVMTESAKPSWKLRWVWEKGTDATLYARFALAAVTPGQAQNWKLDGIELYDDLDGVFSNDAGIVLLDEPTPTLASTYTVVPDDTVIWITVTPPNPLSGSFDLRFRRVDASNYAVVRLDSSGNLTVVSVVGGVDVTTHVSVSSVASAGTTLSIALVVGISQNDCAIYTKTGAMSSSNAWTKRGANFAVNSALAAGTGAQVNATTYVATGLKAFKSRGDVIDQSLSSRLNFVICDGDSLTFGQGATSSAYPVQLSQLMMAAGYVWDYRNFGVGGQFLDQMTADIVSTASAWKSSRRNRNVIVCWGGTNDFVTRSPVLTVEQLKAEIQSYCAAVRAAGWYVIVLTMIARNGAGIPGDFDTKRLEYNTWLRANYASFADGLADVALDTVFDEVADCNNTTYYNADKVHLTATGYGVVAGHVKTALLALG